MAQPQQSEVRTNGNTAAASAAEQPAAPTQPSTLTQQQSTEHLRQLSLDAASDQHQYRSWNRTGVQQLPGSGPVVNSQTIPARGTSPEGVSAHMLHISVRRHYKEKGASRAFAC